VHCAATDYASISFTSRATELASEHPGYVAAAFLGHSTAVANKHYWQVTDEDFERAIQGSSKAVQNPAQHLHVSARTDSQGTSPADEKTPLCRSMHRSARTCLMG
jgi:hypothetical protein